MIIVEFFGEVAAIILALVAVKTKKWKIFIIFILVVFFGFKYYLKHSETTKDENYKTQNIEKLNIVSKKLNEMDSTLLTIEGNIIDPNTRKEYEKYKKTYNNLLLYTQILTTEIQNYDILFKLGLQKNFGLEEFFRSLFLNGNNDLSSDEKYVLMRIVEHGGKVAIKTFETNLQKEINDLSININIYDILRSLERKGIISFKTDIHFIEPYLTRIEKFYSSKDLTKFSKQMRDSYWEEQKLERIMQTIFMTEWYLLTKDEQNLLKLLFQNKGEMDVFKFINIFDDRYSYETGAFSLKILRRLQMMGLVEQLANKIKYSEPYFNRIRERSKFKSEDDYLKFLWKDFFDHQIKQ